MDKLEAIEINGRKIGPGYAPYVVAEISGNHNGKLENALKLIELSKEAGVDAVKLQTYTPDTMTLDCKLNHFQIQDGPWKGYFLYDLYKWAQTPWEWHKELFQKAKELDLTIFSSPFDETAVDFLEELDAPAYKVASFEATDIPLIRKIAEKNKPVIMSTGMANLEEIQESVKIIQEYHNNIIVLHCVSGYPSDVKEANIRTIPDLRERLNLNIGLSDHTLSNSTSIAATTLGACFIEKHITFNREDEGPDNKFSLTPDEFSELVKMSRETFDCLGQAGYELKKSEKSNVVLRRSLFFSKDLKKGDLITKENIRRVRPGNGLAPKYFEEVLGKKVAADVSFGTPVTQDSVEGLKLN